MIPINKGCNLRLLLLRSNKTIQGVQFETFAVTVKQNYTRGNNLKTFAVTANQNYIKGCPIRISFAVTANRKFITRNRKNYIPDIINL